MLSLAFPQKAAMTNIMKSLKKQALTALVGVLEFVIQMMKFTSIPLQLGHLHQPLMYGDFQYLAITQRMEVEATLLNGT